MCFYLLIPAVAPALSKIPAARTITEGDVAIFHCTASGNPTPEIKWMRDDTIVDTGETLTFDTLRDDSGEYWCVAENGFGTTANASAYLDVQCKSEILKWAIQMRDIEF